MLWCPLSEALVVLICGDREWRDIIPIRRELLKRKEHTVLIVHGDCRGADSIAGQVAANLGFVVKAMPANWKRDGMAAGPIRNQLMLDKHDPDVVLAFHKNIKKSKGTKDMMTRGTKHGCIVRLFDS